MFGILPHLTGKFIANQWFGDDNELNEDDPGLIDVSMVEEEPYSSGWEDIHSDDSTSSLRWIIPPETENWQYDNDRGHLYNLGISIPASIERNWNLGINTVQHGLYDTVVDDIADRAGGSKVGEILEDYNITEGDLGDITSDDYDANRSNIDHGYAQTDTGKHLYGYDKNDTFKLLRNTGTMENPKYEEVEVKNPMFNKSHQDDIDGPEWTHYKELVAERDKNEGLYQNQLDREHEDKRDAAERKREGLLSFADTISDLFKDKDYGHVESQFKQFRDV